MLGIVVIPRDAVVIEEGEQAGLVFLNPLLILPRRLRSVIRRIYHVIESLDILLMFPQMATLEAEPVDRFDDRLEDGNERLSQSFQFLVKGAVEQVIVDIPHEVDEAFLLGA